MVLLNICIILKSGIDSGPIPWIWYLIPLALRFSIFMVSFLMIYFFFEKASKRHEHREYWAKIMRIMMHFGLMLNVAFIIVNIIKEVINENEMKTKYEKSNGP